MWETESGRILHSFEGTGYRHFPMVISPDGRLVLAGGSGQYPCIWHLDWELEEKEKADWDEGVRYHLEIFLTQHTPYVAELPKYRQPTEEELVLALTRRGKPAWTEDDFKQLLYTLGCAGYGWLRPEGVRQKLNEMAEKRTK